MGRNMSRQKTANKANYPFRATVYNTQHMHKNTASKSLRCSFVFSNFPIEKTDFPLLIALAGLRYVGDRWDI